MGHHTLYTRVSPRLWPPTLSPTDEAELLTKFKLAILSRSDLRDGRLSLAVDKIKFFDEAFLPSDDISWILLADPLSNINVV